MNPVYISAIAALCGSLIGALSIETTWLTQHHVGTRPVRPHPLGGRRPKMRYHWFVFRYSVAWLPQNIAEMSPSDEFVAILVPQLGRLGLPALFDRLLLVVRVALTRRRNQAGIRRSDPTWRCHQPASAWHRTARIMS
jgi:hypothetical protein